MNMKRLTEFTGLLMHFTFPLRLKNKFNSLRRIEASSIKKFVSPENLKYVLLGMDSTYNGSGFFHLDALTIKKNLLKSIGLFNEKLRLHQDSDLIIKLAFKGNLVPGIIDTPVALRGIHTENRITSVSNIFKTRSLMFSELEVWIQNNIIDEEKAKRFIRKERIIYQQLESSENSINKFLSLVRLFEQEPYLLYLEKEFARLIKGSFGDNLLIKTINKIKILLFRLILSKRIIYWEAQFYQLDSSSLDKN